MIDVVLLAAGTVALIVGVLLVRLERWSITPPLLGLLTGIVLGPQLLNAASIPAGDDARVMQLAARLLLAVALMGIALRYPIDRVIGHLRQVALLVLVVLPAMAAVVAAGAMWTLQVPLGVALVLGAALSPTDPVLASGIVTGEPAELDIPARDRRTLSLESGANDGLALPLVALAVAFTLDRSIASELGNVAYELTGAVVVGAAAGRAAGRSLRWAEQHRQMGPAVRSLYTLVLAASLLGLSGLLGIDGLLSVFVAGLAHNWTVTSDDRQNEVSVDEAMNQYLVIPVFVLLGIVLPWDAWAELGWGGVGFVLFALFLRRLPIVLALRRPLRGTWAHVVWLGWFGPMGIAALFYLGHAAEHGVTDPRLWAAGTLVIAASTVVHGLTAGPGRVLYRRHAPAA